VRTVAARTRSDVEEKLKKAISGAVANFNGDEYQGHYPIRNDLLVFGAQGIGIDDGATFMIDESDLHWDGDVLASPWPPGPAPSEAHSIKNMSFNPAFFMKVDELELSVSTANCLNNDNVTFIGDLVQRPKRKC
jgi:Bacterial RNA polymerase, alpha chain C terminal domain